MRRIGQPIVEMENENHRVKESYRTNESIIREFCERNLSVHTDWTGTRVETRDKCGSVDEFVSKLIGWIEEHHAER